jgi:hypothetical protein
MLKTTLFYSAEGWIGLEGLSENGNWKDKWVDGSYLTSSSWANWDSTSTSTYMTCMSLLPIMYNLSLCLSHTIWYRFFLFDTQKNRKIFHWSWSAALSNSFQFWFIRVTIFLIELCNVVIVHPLFSLLMVNIPKLFACRSFVMHRSWPACPYFAMSCSHCTFSCFCTYVWCIHNKKFVIFFRDNSVGIKSSFVVLQLWLLMFHWHSSLLIELGSFIIIVWYEDLSFCYHIYSSSLWTWLLLTFITSTSHLLLLHLSYFHCLYI